MASEVEITLPREKRGVERNDPRLIVIYAPPKMGKTTLMSTLPNNLILDLEEGAGFVESMSMTIIGWEKPKELPEVRAARLEKGHYYMTEVGASIMKAGRPYDFITVDTATKLEEFALPLANARYKATPIGKDYDGNDVRELPRGAGYLYLRLAFEDCIERIRKLANTVILIGHLRDSVIEKAGKEVNAKDLDLTGKIKQTTCATADAVGYLHRGLDNELLINFKGSDEILCGSRCPHLKGVEVKIADYNKEDNCLENVDWSLIFPDKFNKKID